MPEKPPAKPLKTRVTYLEMRDRPTRTPLAVPPGVGAEVALIRAARMPVSFYRYLYNRIGEDWAWVERRLLDDEDLGRIITDEGVEIHVLHVGGVPAGYGEVDRRTVPGEVEISYFGLMPEFIGLGLGRYLINAIVDIAWASGPERIWLHTCDLDHPHALGNYQKAGFTIYQQRDEWMVDPRIVGLPWPPGQTPPDMPSDLPKTG